ncbi:unnamed protein product [Lepeophtheirus salmonis]|uniref:(salmon louse) hypothetical protein n=1 Tax=Lepeophtheirus salmonis TaxID=72036 RepID=A0A0K2UY96_LEPSM|nr:unnamed protein product [Lepeophtheirus salmonis]CAF2978723.1 unnamed protein product [Lepeophtheirus salmonis]
MTCDPRSDDENALSKREEKFNKRKSGIFDLNDFEELDEEDSGKRRRIQQIDREFKTLKSLIPDVANKSGISKLEIIDASVKYIEELRTKLKPSDQEKLNHSSSSTTLSTTDIESIDSFSSSLRSTYSNSSSCSGKVLPPSVNRI